MAVMKSRTIPFFPAGVRAKPPLGPRAVRTKPALVSCCSTFNRWLLETSSARVISTEELKGLAWPAR